ncbi:MAG: 4Fe-4S binding protein, partial [Chloroflexi bacterium]|nr:4Fe-4S binding protein [Chloroflexota bacterium]
MTPYRWRRLRQVSQWFFLLLFLYLFFGALPDSTALLPVDLFFRANPLAALSTSLARLELLPHFALALVVAGLTLAFGRVWCGWICPLGTVLELFTFRALRQVPDGWRNAKYLLLLTLLILALLANQTLMAFDPIAILTRTLAAVVLPLLNALATGIESVLYAVPPLQQPLDTVEGYIRGPMLPFIQPYFQLNLLLALFFIGLVALNALVPRFWCRYLCPLGGLLSLLSKVALVRRTVGEGCNNCATCATSCPTGTIDPSRGFQSDPAECTVCFDCLTDCPRSGIGFHVVTRPASWREYDPSRRTLLASALTAVTGLALLRTAPAAFRRFATLIRPPGS